MDKDFDKNINPEDESSEIKPDESLEEPDTFDNAPDKEENAPLVQSEELSDYTDADAVYNPQNDTYSYSKQNDGDNSTVNGCIWDKTESKETQKPKKSGNGYKAFIAIMLVVFTISALSAAAFLALDYVDDLDRNNSASSNTPTRNETVTQITTFKEVEGVYTKSQVAAKCAPSSVGIVVEKESSAGGYYDFGFFGNYYSTPQIVQGVGSGFIYDDEGYIITNHHVIEGADKITVYLNDKTELEAQLVGSDSFSDIAVIRVNPEGINLVPMDIGDSAKLVVGDEVVAIGCPAGIEYMGTVTDGIISAINRDVSLSEAGITKTMTLLQTNATINKGNSGGPLINSKGEVIGINTLKLSSSYEGIGFSIPINGALPIITQLIEHGKVIERTENDFVSGEGVIGISVSAITESEAEYYDIPLGVLVIQIDKESSAAKAGLRRGDIITAYNGKSVKSANELNSYKSANKAGDEVTISVYRDATQEGEDETFDLTFRLDPAK